MVNNFTLFRFQGKNYLGGSNRAKSCARPPSLEYECGSVPRGFLLAPLHHLFDNSS